jgi:hypothetical protein
MNNIFKPNRIRWYNNTKKMYNKYFLIWDKNRLAVNRLKQN